MRVFQKFMLIIFVIASLAINFGFFNNKTKAYATNYYSLGTASTGGTWYLIGAGFSSHINRGVEDFKITAEITAGCLANWEMIKRGAMDIAMTNPDLVADAANWGRAGGVSADQVNQLLWSYQTSQLEWYTREGSGINDISDFKDKKIVAGPPGTTSLENNINVIEAITGYKPDEDYKAYYYNFTESKNAIQDRRVDVGLNCGGWPSGLMTDLSSTTKLDWVSLTEEQVKKAQEKHSALLKEVIPKGTYRGMEKDVITLAWSSGFIAHPSLPEEDVYQMMKALFTDKEKREKIHPKAKTYDIEATLEYGAIIAKAGIPFHPGAKKYLKEIGKWSSDLEVKK